MRRRILPLAPWAPYLIVGLVDVVLSAIGSPAADTAKALVMPALGVGVAIAVAGSPRARAIAADPALAILATSIVASWLGDVLIVDTATGLIPAMAAFAAAHLGYIAVFVAPGLLGTGRRPPWWTLGYVVAFLAVILVLLPHLGPMLVPSLVYGLLVVLTAVTSATVSTTLALGGLAFLASDSLLALALFLPGTSGPIVGAVVMGTYILGQGLIAAGVVGRLDDVASRVDEGSRAAPSIAR